LSQMLARLVGNKTDNTLIQVLRFVLVGGLAFAVDFSSLYVLTEYMRLYYLHSAALAFFLGLTTNYLLTVAWVFQKRTFQNRFVEFVIFALLGVLDLGLNQIMICVLTEHACCYYLFSKAIATGLILPWNFGTRKLILFNASGLTLSPDHRPSPQDQGLPRILPGTPVA
jgi:putative flippase GtrA